MKRLLLLYLLIFTIVSPVISQYLFQADSVLKRSVALVCTKNTKGDYLARGTGFFVARPVKEDSTREIVFLVTAKHVVQNKDKTYPKEIYLRMNKYQGGSDFITVPLAVDWFQYIATHPDSTVDIAVILMPTWTGWNTHDCIVIPKFALTDKEFVAKKKISEGDDVVLCGMFQNYLGYKKNYPIFRFGKVAMLTDERVPFEHEFANLYLFEMTTFGGNSGSPVFFKMLPNRQDPQFLGSPKLSFGRCDERILWSKY